MVKYSCADQYRCASALYLMSYMSQCYSVIIYHCISAPVYGKEVIDGLNTINKRYIYQLMSNVRLPGSKLFDSQILIYSWTQNNDVSLSKYVQKHISKDHQKHGVIDQVNYRKGASKIKWTDRDYHVQDDSGVAHKDINIYFDINQFPALPFCGSHSNPWGSKGLSKHYHLRFDPKLGHGICMILRIPCACVSCSTILDQPWIYGIPLKTSTFWGVWQWQNTG